MIKNAAFIIAFILFSSTCSFAQDQDWRIFDITDSEELLVNLFEVDSLDARGMAVWEPQSYTDRLSVEASDDGFIHTGVDTVLYFSAYGTKRAVVVFETLHYEHGEVKACHACGANISVALFTDMKEGRWQIDRFVRHFTTNGAFGENGTAQLAQFGESQWCLALSMDWMGQGIYGEYTSFYDLESLDKLFTYSTHGDNSGAVGDDANIAYAFDQELQFLRNEPTDSGWWDFELITIGTELDAATLRAIPSNRVQRYSFDGTTNIYTKVCP